MNRICEGALIVMLAVTGCARPLPENVSADAEVAERMRSVIAGEDVGGGASAARPDPVGFASLSGVFRVSGTPPQMAALNISGDDASYCTEGGPAPISREVMIAADGGLANVLVYLDMEDFPSGNPLWEHPDDLAQREALLAGDEAFNQFKCLFIHRMFAMRDTQRLVVLNSDPIGHNTKIDANGRARPFNQTIAARGSAEYTPAGSTRGVVPVSCSIHPWMASNLLVLDNPCFAITDETGRFDIPHLPAGVDLELRVFHERLGNVQSVTLSVDSGPGQETRWQRGKVPVNLAADGSQQWEVVIDAATLQ